MWTKDTWEWWLNPNRREMGDGGEDPLGLQLDPRPHPGLEKGVDFLNQPLMPKRHELEFWLSHLTE